jgi:hypothetical protein
MAHIVEQASSVTISKPATLGRDVSISVKGSRVFVNFAAYDNQVAKKQCCIISILQINGKRIKTAFDGAIASDQKVVDLKKVFNAPLAQGIYFLRVDFEGTERTMPFLMPSRRGPS